MDLLQVRYICSGIQSGMWCGRLSHYGHYFWFWRGCGLYRECDDRKRSIVNLDGSRAGQHSCACLHDKQRCSAGRQRQPTDRTYRVCRSHFHIPLSSGISRAVLVCGYRCGAICILEGIDVRPFFWTKLIIRRMYAHFLRPPTPIRYLVPVPAS